MYGARRAGIRNPRALHFLYGIKASLALALSVVGAQRILFGTDSSFFPRGWQKGIYAVQTAALTAAGASDADQQLILGGNFDRLFPQGSKQ